MITPAMPVNDDAQRATPRIGTRSKYGPDNARPDLTKGGPYPDQSHQSGWHYVIPVIIYMVICGLCFYMAFQQHSREYSSSDELLSGSTQYTY